MLNALIKITTLFKNNDINYCVIGGLAMMLYNGRANTVDIDFYVLVDDLKIIKNLLTNHQIPVKSRGEYQLQAKVDGVPIDLLYADHYIGSDVVHRAVEKKLGDKFVRIATPEDIIVLKTLANRSVDRRDIEELRELFGKKLDEKYIQKTIKRINKLLSS